MKDKNGIIILPSDTVNYFGNNPLSSPHFVVIGIHKSENLITLFYEDDLDCKFHETKVRPEDIEVMIRKGEPRSSERKRGKKSWVDQQDDNKTLEYLEMRNKGQLDEWYQPIFGEDSEDEILS